MTELEILELRNSKLQAENNALRRKLRFLDKRVLEENKRLKRQVDMLIKEKISLDNKPKPCKTKPHKKRRNIIYDIYDDGKLVCRGTIPECAKKLGVSKNTVYYWRDRPGKMSTVESKEDKP